MPANHYTSTAFMPYIYFDKSRIVMTLFYRSALLALLVTAISGCDLLYLDQPTQPAPRPIYPNSQPMPQPVSPVVYPQPAQVPVPRPLQTPPLPPSVPQKPVSAPNTSSSVVTTPTARPPSYNEDDINGKVIPVRPPNSISQLPDPS